MLDPYLAWFSNIMRRLASQLGFGKKVVRVSGISGTVRLGAGDWRSHAVGKSGWRFRTLGFYSQFKILVSSDLGEKARPYLRCKMRDINYAEDLVLYRNVKKSRVLFESETYLTHLQMSCIVCTGSAFVKSGQFLQDGKHQISCIATWERSGKNH